MPTMNLKNRRALLIHAFAWLALAGCGGGSTSQDAANVGNPPTPTPTPAPIPTPSPSGALTLVWTPNTETDLGGYRVYYGTSSGVYAQARGGGVDAGRVSEFTISGLQRGVTYYLAVSAYDQSGNESGYSVQISGVAQ